MKLQNKAKQAKMSKLEGAKKAQAEDTEKVSFICQHLPNWDSIRQAKEGKDHDWDKSPEREFWFSCFAIIFLNPWSAVRKKNEKFILNRIYTGLSNRLVWVFYVVRT